MRCHHEMLPSEAMGRRVHVWCYGHFGAPIVVFPSAAGFAHEWEAHGVVEALAPLIDSGRIHDGLEKLQSAERQLAAFMELDMEQWREQSEFLP